MDNIVTGVIGIVLVIVFLAFMAFATKSIAFWIVVAVVLALMFYDFVLNLREDGA
jgi:hypothetical protein